MPPAANPPGLRPDSQELVPCQTISPTLNPAHAILGQVHCRLRRGHSAENLALLNRIGLTLLKADQTVKAGIACKRKTAGWDNNYLIQLLLNTPSI